MEPRRISPKEARDLVNSGRSLFVCAYDDETKCRANNLENSMSFGEFKKKLPTLSKDQGVIFYCA